MSTFAQQNTEMNRAGDPLARIDTLFDRAKRIAGEKAARQAPRPELSPRQTARMIDTQEAGEVLTEISQLTSSPAPEAVHEGLTPERVAKLLEL